MPSIVFEFFLLHCLDYLIDAPSANIITTGAAGMSIFGAASDKQYRIGFVSANMVN